MAIELPEGRLLALRDRSGMDSAAWRFATMLRSTLNQNLKSALTRYFPELVAEPEVPAS